MWAKLLESAATLVMGPGTEPGIIPTLRLPTGQLYLPTLQVLLESNLQACKHCTLEQAVEIAKQNPPAADGDQGACAGFEGDD